MEPFQHAHHQRRKKNTAKVNVTISLVIHLLIVAAGAYWAAHEGVLGKKLQELSVGLLPKDKKPDEAKKAEPKTEEVKKVETAKPVEQQARAAGPAAPKFVPPPDAGAGAAPPAALTIPGTFVFDKDALASGDVIQAYKQQVETILRSRWERPKDLQDLAFVAEVEMAVDSTGKVTGYTWKKGSGNQLWDDSVKQAIASTKSISRRPPPGFPDKFLVRFDVQQATEPLISRAD